MSINIIRIPQLPLTPEKSWAIFYAAMAVLTSLSIGGIYLSSTGGQDPYLLINASTRVNGSLIVEENISVQSICFTENCDARIYYENSTTDLILQNAGNSRLIIRRSTS
ncbi:MAG: hypothetical protein IH845_03865 [Nanoarchaeota archaeon]|nr:hypothetical protein [Nanoarchaeota archaeon]